MASLSTLYAQDSDSSSALHTNFNVDYVIDYRFATTGKAQAEAQFVKLIEGLNSVGLQTEVRNGDNCAVLVFVRLASDQRLKTEVYRSRVQDWLYGVRTAAPEKDMQRQLGGEPITEAERLRTVYLLITKPNNEGGAGITPKSGQWIGVHSIFPLHDHTFNKKWIQYLSSKWILRANDLREIKDKFGEKIGFYFAFLQSYFMFLFFPAGFGALSWAFLGRYSPIYAIGIGMGSIIYVEYWRKEQLDLAVQWGVKGVSKIQHTRPFFQHEAEVKDPITGEQVKVYSPVKRLIRQLLQLPFAIAAAAVLGSLIATCFAIEIFISEVYDGPFKAYLVFLPTVILTTFLPTLSAVMTGFASKLTDIENYETEHAHEAAMIQKVFVLNFITSYLPIFLTAFVYVPFAQIIVPHLDVFQLAVKPFAENEKQMTSPTFGFQIDPERLKKQVIYFTVTAQVVNFALEIVVPYAKRKVFRKYKQVQAGRAAKAGGSNEYHAASDPKEETQFLARVRNEAELDIYDVTSDFREMIVQFGYLSLFSIIWPPTGLSFLINNFIELRGDALKIALETQRPIPWRADSVGPWLDCLSFLAWLGSLTTAALIYLFRGDGYGPDGTPSNIKSGGLLLTLFFSEHIYLVVQMAVRYVLSKMDSPGLQKERAERVSIRRQYLQENLGQLAGEKPSASGHAQGEDFTRGTAGNAPSSGTSEELFWQRQQNPAETIARGKEYIAKAAPNESKKELGDLICDREGVWYGIGRRNGKKKKRI